MMSTIEQLKVEIEFLPTTESLPILHHISSEALQNLKEEDRIKKCFAINEGLINAIKYTERKDSPITLSIMKKEGYIEFVIKNYGAEISKSHLEKLSTLAFEDVLWEESGRGFLIINEIADEWSLSRDEYGRNILKIRMRDEAYV